MRPYSLDLRERIAAAVDHHEGSIRQIGRIFRVSTSFIVRLLQRRRRAGTLDPKPHGGGPQPALRPDDSERLADLVRQQPDATLDQLKQRGGFTSKLEDPVDGPASPGPDAIRRRACTLTNGTGPTCRRNASAFRRKVSTIEPKRLIFVDETNLTTTMTRPTPGRRADSGPSTRLRPRGRRSQ